MKKIINAISEYVFHGKEVPEDLIYEFSTEAAQMIEGHDTEQISEEFWKLNHYVVLYWRGGKYTYEKSAVRIFQMGQLLSYMNMIRMYLEKVENDTSLNEYAKSLHDRYLFFKSIHDEEGITHKKLANKTQISISALSQFVNKIKGNGFILTRVMGREKHYYLTAKGEKLLGIMQEDRMHSHRRYEKLLSALYNFNKSVSNDTAYKAVITNETENLIEDIYALNKAESDKRTEHVLKIWIEKY